MTPPMIPPTMTDVMPSETESGADTRISCVVAVDILGVSCVIVVDVLGVSGVIAVETFSVLMCVLVVSEVLVIGASGIVIVVDENENDDDEVVVAAGDSVSVMLGTAVVAVL